MTKQASELQTGDVFQILYPGDVTTSMVYMATNVKRDNNNVFVDVLTSFGVESGTVFGNFLTITARHPVKLT